MDIKDSLCSSCKWGLCMKQEAQAEIHGNFPLFPPQEDQIEMPTWEDEEPADETQRHIAESRICSLCYYNPEGRNDPPTVVPATVKQCNKYEPDEKTS